MRVIAGKYRSRIITSGIRKNQKLLYRPTTDRARESLFNIISNVYDLEGKTCLDLFCGTGSVGIEMLSRGAAKVFFVDRNVNVIKSNRFRLGLESASVFQNDVLFFLRNFIRKSILPDLEYFDLIFADPPYKYNNYPLLIELVLKCGNLFILEHNDDYNPLAQFKRHIFLKRKIGKTIFTFFKIK